MDLTHVTQRDLRHAGARYAALTWRLLVVLPIVWTWKATAWTVARSWGGAKRTGRFALWLLFWPLALWRTYRRSKERDLARLEAAIKARP